MFQSISAQPLFPTLIWKHVLPPDDAARLNLQLLGDLDRLTSPRPKLRAGETWQTEQCLHELPEFQELVEMIKAAGRNVMDRLEIEYDDITITGCFACLNPPGAPHNPHTHPNNLLSGVYYVKTPSGADSICFHDPRFQVDVISPNYKRLNEFNSIIQTVKVEAGTLVVFPSWLVHSVVANRSNQLRVSIPFNLMPTNYVEKISRPKWQGIPVRRTAAEPAGDPTVSSVS